MAYFFWQKKYVSFCFLKIELLYDEKGHQKKVSKFSLSLRVQNLKTQKSQITLSQKDIKK